LVPAQGFEPWTIGLKVAPRDVRRVLGASAEVHSVLNNEVRLSV